MTIYALDLGQVQQTIRDTLAERVLPAIDSGDARSELLSVIEMLDSLAARLAWDPGPLAATASRTADLGAALGQPARTATPPTESGELSALREHRASIAAALSSAYANGIDPAIVGAVAEFTTADIQAEISPGLRRGLPD
ncbi:hypothetical protein MCHIJ_02230 [Mycolicibacterium chitae]|uniref:Uncharacterized protein n=1 Tax=Mycolicibacterium chitae TaxID=1792 RepID=A0A448IB02_MYCCI|nr:hypothetical protein [Mycolicibacterium chitae]MCV7108553.1 hypothetical protein [Mycolicibacterium chitae]BBZ00786.1 hypothetical protein MCHIJ_02230 [Mycolicibacterium chitae]VEG49634.1 Uncharacterised protein [Mycolicibacterium chitae]